MVIRFALLQVEQEKIQKEDIVSLLQALFREAHCQSQIMTDRRNIYILFKYCLLNKIEGIVLVTESFHTSLHFHYLHYLQVAVLLQLLNYKSTRTAYQKFKLFI